MGWIHVFKLAVGKTKNTRGVLHEETYSIVNKLKHSLFRTVLLGFDQIHDGNVLNMKQIGSPEGECLKHLLAPRRPYYEEFNISGHYQQSLLVLN